MVEEAQARSLAATHRAVDKAADGTDLPSEQPYGYHHDLTSNDEVDGYHAEPVCSSSSQVRLVEHTLAPLQLEREKTKLLVRSFSSRLAPVPNYPYCFDDPPQC